MQPAFPPQQSCGAPASAWQDEDLGAEQKGQQQQYGVLLRLARLRRRNFAGFACAAALVMLVMAFAKWQISMEGELELARGNLAELGQAMGGAMQSRFQADLRFLDILADLWSLDSTIPPDAFRRFVAGPLAEPVAEGRMASVVLVHRVLQHQREAVESNELLRRRRRQCCNGTDFDLPPLSCRQRARKQCAFGGDRLHLSNAQGVAPVSPEYVAVLYSEPFQENPGPQGFDMRSHAARNMAWEKAKATGRKVFNRRVRRIFAERPEFGLLIWNPVYVDAAERNRSLFEGVQLRTREELLRDGREPYAIGSVNGVYRTQRMAARVMREIFAGDEALRHVTVFVFDRHPEAEPTQSLLAYYTHRLPDAELSREVVERGSTTLDEVLAASKEAFLSEFSVNGSDGRFAVVLVPEEAYFDEHKSQMPRLILLLSIVLVGTAQLDRWVGHPGLLESRSKPDAAGKQYGPSSERPSSEP